jgi:hypothetical protein
MRSVSNCAPGNDKKESSAVRIAKNNQIRLFHYDVLLRK